MIFVPPRVPRVALRGSCAARVRAVLRSAPGPVVPMDPEVPSGSASARPAHAERIASVRLDHRVCRAPFGMQVLTTAPCLPSPQVGPSRASRVDHVCYTPYVVPRSARLLYTGAARFIGAQPRRRSLSPIHLSRIAWRAAWCRAVRLMQLAVLPRVLAIVLSRMCLGS